MVDERTWSRIVRYVTGECADEEKRAFEVQLRSDRGLQEAVDEVRRIWAGAELPPGAEPELADWDLAATWQEFVRRSAARPALEVVQGKNVSRRPALRPWMAAAAALAVVTGAALWFRGSVGAGDPTSAIAAASMYTVVTQPGQRLDLRMPDGSRIVLAAASTLRYPKAYGGARRDVYLDGRAYFEVVHDATKPFAVHAGGAVVRDLGTRFDVRAYRGNPRVEVAVADGVVELASSEPRATADAKPVVLAAGQLGRVDAAGAVTSQSGIDVGRYIAWTEGRLVFVDAALRDVVPELSRWYGLDFTLADSGLGERRFTGTFSNESLTEVLQFLTLSTGSSYQRDGRTITLSPLRPLR